MGISKLTRATQFIHSRQTIFHLCKGQLVNFVKIITGDKSHLDLRICHNK